MNENGKELPISSFRLLFSSDAMVWIHAMVLDIHSNIFTSLGAVRAAEPEPTNRQQPCACLEATRTLSALISSAGEPRVHDV